MANVVYEASEYNAGLPVAVAEVDALIARAGKPIKETTKLIHFLTRVRETIDSLNVDLAHLRRRVDELSVQSSRRGAPTTLNPVDALRYADPVEIEAVVDNISRQRLTTLRAMVAQAETELRDITTLRDDLTNTLRALGEMSEPDPEIIEHASAALTESVPTVSASHVLDESFYTSEDSQWEKDNHPEVADLVAQAQAHRDAEITSDDDVDDVRNEDPDTAASDTSDRDEAPTATSDDLTPDAPAGDDHDTENDTVDDTVEPATSPVTAIPVDDSRAVEVLASAPVPTFDIAVEETDHNPFAEPEPAGWADEIDDALPDTPDSTDSGASFETAAVGFDAGERADNDTDTDLESGLFGDDDDTDTDLGSSVFGDDDDTDLGSSVFGDDTDTDLGSSVFGDDDTDTDLESGLFGDDDDTPDTDLESGLFGDDDDDDAPPPSPANPFAKD